MPQSSKPDFQSFYNSLLIGCEVSIHHNNKWQQGQLMDKYLSETNVFGDIIIIENGVRGEVLEHQPFFAGDYTVIRVV